MEINKKGLIFFALFNCFIILPAFAQISCNDIKYGNKNYHSNMDRLADIAGLQGWDKYHEGVVSSFCKDDFKGVDIDVDNGYVELKDALGIAKALGKKYIPKRRSEIGKSYGYSKQRFQEIGSCSVCSDNIAQHYTKTPNSRCGKLAKQALEGNPEAVKILLGFPDYCKWGW